MSAGGLVGLVMNLFVASGLWTVLGVAVDVIGNAFNSQMKIMPTFQDAVTGFTIMQTAWSAIMVIIFFGLLINYFVNENSMASGEV